MKEREFLKDLVKRFSALYMAMTMLYTALPVQATEDNAEGIASDLTTVNPSQTEVYNTEGTASGTGSVYYDPDAETPTEDAAEGGSDTTIKIGNDSMVVTSDSSWQEPGVIGEDKPTAEAPSLEDFSAMLGQGIPAEENLYTLSAATGIMPGTSVEYFAVRYLDDESNPQTKYIFPEKNLTQSNAYITEGLTNTDITNRHYILSQRLGYHCNDLSSMQRIEPLQPWSQDEYIFTTERPIKEITGIEVFMGKGNWTVQGLAVSKVIGLNGIGEYGFISGKYFVALEKQRICYLQSKKSGTLTIPAAYERLVNIGGAESIYFSLMNDPGDSTNKSAFNDIYTFRIDFADTIDGGIETLLRQNAENSSPLDGMIAEDLALEVEYRDRNNFTRSVTMPVLLSVLAQLAESGVDVKTAGLAQRGDSLAFTGVLPEYSSLISTKIYVGKAARDRLEATGGFKAGNADDDRTLLETNLNTDQIAISGVSIYKGTCQMSNTPAGTDRITGESLQSYTYTYAYSSKNPEMFYTTTNPNGLRINAGTSETVRLTSYQEGARLIGAERTGNFLITMKTTDAIGADTEGDVMVRLTYMTLDGVTKTTAAYNARTEMQNDLGYWPTIKSATGNYAYEQGVARGGCIQFPITLESAAAITNVEVMLGYGADEWRLESICASVMYDEGRRMVYRQDVNSGDNVSPYRMVRPRETTALPPFPLLVQKLFVEGESASVSMQSGSIVDTTSEVDYNAIRYNMTHEQTKMNLGFINRKKTYEVMVKVADDPGANSINGDSGSRNYFYFALEFKNGTSGLVLANQQLTADAFRAGYEESFTITVNRDYSDLTAVRIIPEDLDVSGNMFDKLNIDRITVTEQTFGGAGMQYVIDPVGWIGIDYHDSGESQSTTGRKERYLSEIAHKYTVNYQQKVVNFLCEIATQPWDGEFAYSYKQVTGSVMCDLDYIDKDNQPQTISFDVISRMASYMGKTPISFEGATDGTDKELYTNMKTVSDPNWMLRPNHTDRFILPPLANVQSIQSMTFYATSRNNKPGKWVIGGVSLSQVTRDNGKVDLTADGEYLRSMTIEPYCKSKVDRGKVQLYLPAGMTQSVTIEFEDNLLAWTADNDSSWITSVSRTPESSNDELNLYLYPKSNCLDIQGQVVSAALKYTQPYTSGDQKRIGELKIYNSGKSDAMFYAQGVQATNMQTLTSLIVQCRNSHISFDHAVVQQIRDDVIVNTYYIKLNTSAIFEVEKKPEDVVPEDAIAPRKQKMLLSFGAKTEEATLFAEKNDIAIALKYRSTIDNGQKEYFSPYI